MNTPIEKRIPVWELMSFLHDVETGKVILTPTEDPDDIYAGEVEYKASNGWTIVVFNDCASFDYIDRAETPDGRRIDFDDLADDAFHEKKGPYYEAYCYRPEREVERDRYQINRSANRLNEG